MAGDPLDYPQLVRSALKGVMRRALALTAESGLPGDHHFYISFRTGDPGVRLAPRLRKQFSDEMTIVLQHRFHGLEVDGSGFAVSLSFGGAPERVAVPFDAVIAFADPAADFALRFEPEGAQAAASGAPAPDVEPEPHKAAAEEEGAKVVAVDFARRGRRQGS